MAKSTAKRFRYTKSARTAIVFLHGFAGDAEKTWGQFTDFLASQPELKGWDIWSLGFSTSLFPEVRGIWTADPGIALLAAELRTRCVTGDLTQYERLVLISHSMGGLLAQRAIMDFPDVLQRIDALFLFGVPSLGLHKARIFRILKLQVRDMCRNGSFIRNLRQRWAETFRENTEPFSLHAIAGTRDEFVPSESSLAAFPKERHFCVPGSHTSLVKPDSSDAECVQLVVRGIRGVESNAHLWSSEQMAIARGEFNEAKRRLWAHASELTNEAAVDLALALDATNQREAAIKVLEERNQPSTDVLGTLAGRYKRLWLFDGTRADVERSYALYSQGLEASEASDNSSQIFYHSINLAFLELTHLRRPGRCRDYARKALSACERTTSKDFWNLATQGEAWLYLNDLDRALGAYRDALSLFPKRPDITTSTRRKNGIPTTRDVDSTYTQAMLAAERSLGERPASLSRLFRQAGV